MSLGEPSLIDRRAGFATGGYSHSRSERGPALEFKIFSRDSE